MPAPNLDAEAPFGSLDPSVHRDLILVRRFLDDRDKALGGLLGDVIKKSPLRLELVRAILVEFGRGHHAAVGHYQRHAAQLASTFAVRQEIYRLADMRLLITRRLAGDQRTTLVIPTVRLVMGVSRAVPKIASKLERIFLSRADMRE
jgi:hypothetical protein